MKLHSFFMKYVYSYSYTASSIKIPPGEPAEPAAPCCLPLEAPPPPFPPPYHTGFVASKAG